MVSIHRNKHKSIDMNKFTNDLKYYREHNTRAEFDAREDLLRPMVDEYRGNAGYPGSYFGQDYWGQKELRNTPLKSILI